MVKKTEIDMINKNLNAITSPFKALKTEVRKAVQNEKI